jgi:hypothetical protein
MFISIILINQHARLSLQCHFNIYIHVLPGAGILYPACRIIKTTVKKSLCLILIIIYLQLKSKWVGREEV